MKKIITLILIAATLLTCIPSVPFIAEEKSPLEGLNIGLMGSDLFRTDSEKHSGAEDKNVIGIAQRIAARNNVGSYKVYAQNSALFAKYNDYPYNSSVGQYSVCKWIGDQAASVSKNHDVIFILSGENDADNNVPTGKVSSSFDKNDFDLKTYAGGLEYTLAVLREKAPTTAIGLIFPYKFKAKAPGRYGDLKAYLDVSVEICEKWGVSILDLYSTDLGDKVDEAFYWMTSPTLNTIYSYIHEWAGDVAQNRVTGEHTHEYGKAYGSAELTCRSGCEQTSICKHCAEKKTEFIEPQGHKISGGKCQNCLFKGEKGDVNEDGYVNTNDATELLYSIFYPDDYKVDKSKCDFNGDGSVTENDAVHFLKWMFYPDEYKLK